MPEEEWNIAIRFLTDAGHITDAERQEFILLSDVLGASMQTIAVNNQAYRDATEATVFGPFRTEHAPEIELGGDIAGGASGMPCWVEGAVTDVGDRPIPGARIEAWEADDEGFYDVQYGDDRVAAPGYRRRLVTHIFAEGDEQLVLGDSVFGVKDSLYHGRATWRRSTANWCRSTAISTASAFRVRPHPPPQEPAGRSSMRSYEPPHHRACRPASPQATAITLKWHPTRCRRRRGTRQNRCAAVPSCVLAPRGSAMTARRPADHLRRGRGGHPRE